jgi:YesN/AraC family two-component response regulator
MLEKNIVLDEESRTQITKTQTQNQALKDVTNASLSEEYLKNVYGNKDAKTILNTLGVDSKIAQTAVDQRKALLDEKAKADKLIADQKAEADRVAKINKELPTYVNLFVDPTKSDAVLAKEYCKGKSNVENCESYFKRTDVIAVLDKTSEDYKKYWPKDKKPSRPYPPSSWSVAIKHKARRQTKQEIINCADTAHAFWVYTSKIQLDNTMESPVNSLQGIQ